MRKTFLAGAAAAVVYWLADHALILLNETSNLFYPEQPATFSSWD